MMVSERLALVALCFASATCGHAPSGGVSESLPTLEDFSGGGAGAEPETADLRLVLEPLALPLDPALAKSPRVYMLGAEAWQQAMGDVVLAHRDELDGCRSEGLIDAQTLLHLYLELDDEGVVLGGGTSPLPGQEGTAAVARCILKSARRWSFSPRNQRGRTILIVPFLVQRVEP